MPTRSEPTTPHDDGNPKNILLCATALLVAACEKNDDRATYYREHSGVLENGSLLRNDLPPELIEGTPIPIVLSGLPATLVAPQLAQGPGSLGVTYGLMEESP